MSNAEVMKRDHCDIRPASRGLLNEFADAMEEAVGVVVARAWRDAAALESLTAALESEVAALKAEVAALKVKNAGGA